VGLIVLADASFIEPIAVHAGLWSWYSAGVFSVPLVGIAGWGLFALLCSVALARKKRRTFAVLLTVPTLHLLLLASWWSVFRWIEGPLPAWSSVFCAWILSTSAAIFLYLGRNRVPLSDVARRLPGAVFFFALLLVRRPTNPDLLAYALAFIPPYVVLMGNSRMADLRAVPKSD
jgi:hypothetical protein